MVAAVLLASGGTAIGAQTSAQPQPLRGASRARTGLRLLVSNDPPFFLDVDSGRTTPAKGLHIKGSPVLSVQAVGRDAVIWLDRRTPTPVPRAEIYALRHGARAAKRIATGSDVAPASDGLAVWVKSFKDTRHCTLSEIGLDGHQRRGPRPLPCSWYLGVSGLTPVVGPPGHAVDPLTGRTLLRGRIGIWAIGGHLALTVVGNHGPLALRDLRSGHSRPLRWPSRIGGTATQGGIDQAVVQPNGRLIALDFADPAYRDTGTQVMDAWTLDPVTGSFKHVPSMPAAVALKFTSMAWTGDGRLVILGNSGNHDLVAVWRPGEKRLLVRSVRIPARNSGSDAFVVW